MGSRQPGLTLMRRARPKWACVVLLFVVFIALLVVARTQLAALLHGLSTGARQWEREAPLATAVGGVLLVCVWIILLIPSTPVELTLGYIYGVRVGMLLVYSGKVLGCLASFFLGRSLLRDICQQHLSRHN